MAYRDSWCRRGRGGSSRRRAGLLALVAALGAAVTGCAPAAPAELALPPQYLGLDSVLHWDKLPYLELGDRVGGQSTADPAGSNHDNVQTLGDRPGGGRVLLDQAGPGIVTFMRMQQATGGPWQLAIDGRPPATLTKADLGQSASRQFPYPLSLNTGQSQGSSILATSLPYNKSLQFASAGPNGNFYSMYRRLPIDAPVPQWTDQQTAQAAATLNSTGGELLPAGLREEKGAVQLAGSGVPAPVTTIEGSEEIRAITFRVPFDEKARFGNARLQIFWDGEPSPSVDAPVKFLAGDGAGVYQPAGRDLVRSLPATVGGDGKTYLEYSLYWPMPFTASARIALVPRDAMPSPITYSVRHQPFTDPPSWVGQFHANYTDTPNPLPGKDMSFLDFHGSGKLVGTVVNFGAVGGTLEGDPHIYLDDSRTPQLAVTGTEEWGMGGDYWNGGKQTTLPLAGLPSSTDNPAGSEVDGAAEYRFLIADSVPFNNHIVVNWEHGAVNDSTQRYRAAMLWYGTPTPTAVAGDELVPGSPQSAGAHGYQAPGDRQYSMTSAYEYTVQSEPMAKTVAATAASTTFTMALPANNLGGFLRRTLDSCVPNQRGNVFIDGQFAGSWYTAESPGRADSPDRSRCWRDDDLPLPKSLTAGKRSINVRIENVAADPQRTPWTAADYQLLAFTPA